MSTTYGIRGWVAKSNKYVCVPITEQEYHSVLAAKIHLMNFVAIEDAFDQFIENYFEYEADAIGLAQRQLLQRAAQTWSGGQLETQTLNRRTANLLTSARWYQDVVARITKPLGRKSSIHDQWMSHRTAQHNRLLGHRAMEMLRNYTQHRAAPITRVITGSRWSDDQEHNVFSVVPLVRVNDLRLAFKKFGKSGKLVIEELENLGKFIPLTPLVREYVEGL